MATRVLLAEQAERVVGVLVWHWLQPMKLTHCLTYLNYLLCWLPTQSLRD